MKCCSRSTLGVIIGALNILAYFIGTIFIIVAIVQKNAANKRNPQLKDAFAFFNTLFVIIIVAFLIMILISGLLITGIVNRRHKLMVPWLILSGIGFVVNCARFGSHIIFAIIQGISLTTVIVVFMVGLVAIAISAMILWPIYTLYRDMRKENSQTEYQASPNYYKT